MATREEKIPLDGELHPIGTLVFTEHPEGDGSTLPLRTIWRVIAHKECQDFPTAPVRVGLELQFVREELLND